LDAKQKLTGKKETKPSRCEARASTMPRRGNILASRWLRVIAAPRLRRAIPGKILKPKKPMTTQLKRGKLLKEAGTKRALESADAKWRSRFNVAAASFLALYGEVMTDDVIKKIGMPPGHPNAVGAAMLAFARTHKLAVRSYVKSTRPSCHAAVIAVWSRGL
jgi:hypothetical protein